jgi:Flp pilus assembly protein TadD
LATLVAILAGCSSRPKTAGPGDYRTVGKDPRRDTELAQQENTRGAKLLEDGKYDEAEQALKRALIADIMFGPAHNNLGKVYYHAGKYYLAAWEFEYACKLMPHQPEPHNNLGLVFEAVGKLDDAVKEYSEAIKIEPNNPQFLGNGARARLRRGDRDAELHELLSKLVMVETRPEWVKWAQERLAVVSKGAGE